MSVGQAGIVAARWKFRPTNTPLCDPLNHDERAAGYAGAMKSEDNIFSQPGAERPFSGRRSERLRQRAAWMYYVEEMTQNAIAEALGVGRVTVVRMLSEARAMNEVRISLSRDVAELSGLEIQLQRAFAIPEAVVAPISSATADPISPIGAATGQFVSDMLRPGMKIGLGWGRTLFRSLSFLNERQVPGLSVVSLLGGVTHVREVNPAEFAWQFSRIFLADCYLLAAPAIVDSAATKEALIERCGLRKVFDFSKSMDAVVVATGSIAPTSTTARLGFLSKADQDSLIERRAVGEVMCNFFDRRGKLIDHPFNERVMSIPIETIAATPIRILCSGGLDKVDAMIGAIKLIKPTVLITDEVTAAALIRQRPQDS